MKILSNRTLRRLVLTALILAGVGFGIVPADACPGCKMQGEMVELAEPATVSASMALSWSVLFMIGVVGGVGTFLFVYIRATVARLDRDSDQG